MHTSAGCRQEGIFLGMNGGDQSHTKGGRGRPGAPEAAGVRRQRNHPGKEVVAKLNPLLHGAPKFPSSLQPEALKLCPAN